MGSPRSLNAIELFDQEARNIRYDYNSRRLQFCDSVSTNDTY